MPDTRIAVRVEVDDILPCDHGDVLPEGPSGWKPILVI